MVRLYHICTVVYAQSQQAAGSASGVSAALCVVSAHGQPAEVADCALIKFENGVCVG